MCLSWNRGHLATLLLPGLLLASTGWPPNVLAWGDRGHEAIANVALDLVTPATRARLDRILGHQTLAQAATWPDHIRPGARLAETAEARQFNLKFPDNGVWHYVNLPLATTTFPAGHRLVHRHNIVEQINACVDVLEGKSRKMLPRHALCWLAHLVGDLHQPLHVGCGFFTFAPDGRPLLITRPDQARPDQHDRGANQILLPGNRRLHGYWDGEMVRAVWEPHPGARLETLLLETSRGGTLAPPTGSPRSWPQQWAMDSVRAANRVYEGLTLGKRIGTDTAWQIPATWTDSEAGYRRSHADLARQRLAAAAVHLAALLDQIRWK